LLAFALLVVAAPATAASPAKQPVATGFYQGQEVSYFDFGPIKLKPGNKLAPIWTVTNGAAGQHNIIATVARQSGLLAVVAAQHGHLQRRLHAASAEVESRRRCRRQGGVR